MQIFHVVLTGGLEVYEDRRGIAQRIQMMQVEGQSQSSRNRRQVNDAVCGSTDGRVLGIVIALLGMSVNLFSLVPAAISETYGSQRTAAISSFANMLAQFSGATALAVSGYVGISLNSQPGNAIGEYRGIWLSGMVGMAIMATLGVAAYVAYRAGWAVGPRPVSSLSEEAKL